MSLGYVPAGNSRLSLRLAGGIYYQQPFYKEYRQQQVDSLGNYYVALNNKIKSPRSVHVILGGDYTFRAMDRPFKFTTELYYKHLSRIISYEVDNLKLNYTGYNGGNGYIAPALETIDMTDGTTTVAYNVIRKEIMLKAGEWTTVILPAVA